MGKVSKKRPKVAKPATKPAPAKPEPVKPWWDGPDYILEPEPIFHHETGDLLGFATVAKALLNEEVPAGIIAVFTPYTRTPAMARFMAQGASRSPEHLDMWRSEIGVHDFRDQAPFVQKVPVITQPASDHDLIDMGGEVLHIAQLAWKALPPIHPVYVFFEIITRKERDDGLDDEFVIRYAKQAFFELPQPMREHIFNGWAYPDDMQTTDELRACEDMPYSHRVLEIRFHERDGGGDEIGTDCGWKLTHSHEGAPVTMHVLAGTTKTKTLHAIDEFRPMLDREWETVIGPNGNKQSARKIADQKEVQNV